jgi:hypothetical protein
MAYNEESGMGPDRDFPTGDRYYGPAEWNRQGMAGGYPFGYGYGYEYGGMGGTGYGGAGYGPTFGQIDRWGGIDYATGEELATLPGRSQIPDYRGRGPRNYRRSDARIEEDINEQLTLHPLLDATDIEVSVKDGEVTLSGMVEGRRARRMAEEVADGVSGVRDVHNQIRVR